MPNDEVLPLAGFRPIPSLATLPGHVTYVAKVYHQRPGENATQVDLTWERQLTDRTLPVTRDVPLTEKWIEVACPRCSLIVVENHRPRRQVIPTPEERQAEDDAAVWICFDYRLDHPHLLVRPGEGHSFHPFVGRLYLRCAKGSTTATVTTYPE